jgi:protein-arginine kinase activator protein McsA
MGLVSLYNGNKKMVRRIELMVKIRNLKDLLAQMIRIEEYELCGQLRDIIRRREEELTKLDTDTTNSEQNNNV